VSWTFNDVTLSRDGGALYLQFAHGGRLLVADRDVPVLLFGDRHVYVNDQLVDLKERKTASVPFGIRRIGDYNSSLLIEGGDGAYYTAYSNLGSISLYGLQLRIIGVDRNELVFEHPWTTLEVLAFDVGKRTWRTLSYASCVPQK
jgi:hypothetical protein